MTPIHSRSSYDQMIEKRSIEFNRLVNLCREDYFGWERQGEWTYDLVPSFCIPECKAIQIVIREEDEDIVVVGEPKLIHMPDYLQRRYISKMFKMIGPQNRNV